MIEDRLSRWTIIEFIEKVAKCAEAFGNQAGVGGMETAGQILSYLAKRTEDIEPFMVGGIFELPDRWFEHGCLTWHAQNGKIVQPDFVRRARAIKKMEKGA